MNDDAESWQVQGYRKIIDTSGFEVRALEIASKRTTSPLPFDILQVLPDLKARAKTTVRLHPRRLALDESLPRNVSKIGGDLLWPAAEPWPMCPNHEIPWVGVLQLCRSDFPEFPFKPGSDLFQILWCPQVYHGRGGAPEAVCYWRDSASIGPLLNEIPRPRFRSEAESDIEEAWSAYQVAQNFARMLFDRGESLPESLSHIHSDPSPPDPGEPKYAYTECLPQPCRLFPERVLEFPREVAAGELLDLEKAILDSLPLPEEERQRGEQRYDSFLDYYRSELSVASGTKLLGFPKFIQRSEYPKCSRGHQMEHLLSFDSEEPTDGRWQAIEDRDLARDLFEKRSNEPCRRAWRALSEPTQMSFGDVGRNYVFLCRECPEWPTATFLQCS